MDVLVRDLRPDEAEAAARVLSQLGHAVPPDWLGKWVAALDVTRDRALGACHGDSLVGVAFVHNTPFPHEASFRARVTAIVVDEPVRDLGVGRRLLEACETAARAMGSTSIELTTADSRGEAHAFYERAGYATNARRFFKPLSSR